MPADLATVTEKGLKFKNLLYSSPKLIADRWFEIARNKRSWKENIAYDPRNMNFVYIKTENNKSFIKCEMLDKRLYNNKTLDEIENLYAYQKLKLDRNQEKLLQSNVDFFTKIESIVQAADKMTAEQKDRTVSNTERTKNIREKRKSEKYIEKAENAFILDAEKESEKANIPNNVIPIRENETDKYKYPSHIEYLKKKQKERMDKKDE